MSNKKIVKELEENLKRGGYKNYKKIMQIFQLVSTESIRSKDLRVLYISNKQLNLTGREIDLSCVIRIEIGNLKENVECLEAQDLNKLVKFFEDVKLKIAMKIGNDIKYIRSF